MDTVVTLKGNLFLLWSMFFLVFLPYCISIINKTTNFSSEAPPSVNLSTSKLFCLSKDTHLFDNRHIPLYPSPLLTCVISKRKWICGFSKELRGGGGGVGCKNSNFVIYYNTFNNSILRYSLHPYLSDNYLTLYI